MHPSSPRQVFIIGNKRSGTSHLVRILNVHPRVFVSHESDIAWILYQLHLGRPMQAHPWDSDRGMRITLETCGHLLRRDRPPQENFEVVQHNVMQTGNPWLPSMRKPHLQWLGDKKPFQHTDPKIIAFILEHFPDARFLHIVRHPFAVAASSNRFNRTRNGDFWLGLSDREKVERWAFHEQQVQRLKRRINGRMHTLRYEDLCAHPAREAKAIFGFLEIEADAHILGVVVRETRPGSKGASAVACSELVSRLAGEYGYELKKPNSRIRVLGKSFFRKVATPFGS